MYYSTTIHNNELFSPSWLVDQYFKATYPSRYTSCVMIYCVEWRDTLTNKWSLKNLAFQVPVGFLLIMNGRFFTDYEIDRVTLGFVRSRQGRALSSKGWVSKNRCTIHSFIFFVNLNIYLIVYYPKYTFMYYSCFINETFINIWL